MKHAIVTEIGVLQNPPLPPHTNVFRVEFAKKQMGHRAYFFKASSNKELQRWIADLSWRVETGERQIAAKFEPNAKFGVGGGGPTAVADRRRELQLQPSISAASRESHDMRRKLVDETERGIDLAPERVLGMMVRYDVRHVVEEESDSEDEQEKAIELAKKKREEKKKAQQTGRQDNERGTFGGFK